MANREGSPAFRGWAILIAAGVLTVVIGFVVFFRGADGVEPNAWPVSYTHLTLPTKA